MTASPLIEVRDLSVVFSRKRSWFRPRTVFKAVDGASFALPRGEALGIVGESGSGKTTVAGALLNLVEPTRGEVLFDGKPVRDLDRRLLARRMQPVFQDPYSSLNPHRTVARIIAEPLDVHGLGTAGERRAAVQEIMARVGLQPRLAWRYPAELSGGQRQRVAIARALMLRPEVLICDEPTSALDVSVQAQILALLRELKSTLLLTFVFISHNLAVVEQFADQLIVMQHGRIVERGRTADIFARPEHPYTRLLLESVLNPDPDRKAFAFGGAPAPSPS